jgi:RNA polymerase sigma-70 factor (ECF subfamily)
MDAVDPTDALLDRVRAGDQAALGELLERHRDFMRRVVELRMDPRLRGRVDASDVVQEAQLEVARRIGDFLSRAPMPFVLWLRQTACENLLRVQRFHLGTARRNASREVALPERSSALLARHLLERDEGAKRLLDAELSGRVSRAMGELSEADREILLLRCFEGLTNQEAAAVLGVEAATASQRYGRAVLRLRRLLTAEGQSDA